jgi:hypothetical protein
MMKKIFTLSLLVISLSSCNKGDSVDCQNLTSTQAADIPAECIPVQSDDPDSSVDLTTALPNEAYTFDTNIDFLNTTTTQQDKFDQAIELIKRVVATEEFRTAVINHTYNGSKTFVDNGGYTNSQIYQKMLEGAETLQPLKNNTMDMEVELYYAATSTVGYTNSGTTRIWVNTKYFNTNSFGGVAANLVHEWLHKLGFRHASSYTTSRDYSVPYAVGRMISRIGSTSIQ